MAGNDFASIFNRLQTGAEAMMKLQQSFARYAMPVDQQRALLDGVSRVMFPGEQLQVMVDLIDSFGPPLAQLDRLQEQLDEQRAQVQTYIERLDEIDRVLSRMATAGEQLVSFQEPFVKLASALTGQTFKPSASAGGRSATADDTDTDTDTDTAAEAENDEDDE